MLIVLICPTGEAEYFCKRGWTLICPTGGDLPVGQELAGVQPITAI
jgi:hypothetical protein